MQKTGSVTAAGNGAGARLVSETVCMRTGAVVDFPVTVITIPVTVFKTPEAIGRSLPVTADGPFMASVRKADRPHGLPTVRPVSMVIQHRLASADIMTSPAM